MSKADRETVLSDLTSRIFSAMLGEIAMDAAIQGQREVRRTMSICKICGTRCNQIHTSPTGAPMPGNSRAGTPTVDNSSQPGTSTPGGNGKSEGNINLDCVNCQRPVASNRYAQHLATCLGIGTGVRRTAQRTAVTKTKTNANTRPGSPYVDDADDTKSIKGKAKAKGKQTGADEEQGDTQKQPGTPRSSPPKKQQKKGKASLPASGTGPPRHSGNRLGPPSSKPPSKVRSTPTPSVASHVSKTSHSPSARSDSSDAEGDSGAEAESRSSMLSGVSPTLPNAESIGRGRSKTGSFSLGPGSAGSGSKPKKITGTGPPTKKQQPPTPQLPSLAPPAAPPVIRRAESNFLIDIEGEETGSDTD